MTPDELVGFSELPDLLASAASIEAVGRTTAYRYSQRDDFPAPLDTLASGRVWRRRDVERWAKKHLPLKPGPKPRS